MALVRLKVTGLEPVVVGWTVRLVELTAVTEPRVTTGRGAAMWMTDAVSGLPVALNSTREPTNSAATVVAAPDWKYSVLDESAMLTGVLNAPKGCTVSEVGVPLEGLRAVTIPSTMTG